MKHTDTLNITPEEIDIVIQADSLQTSRDSVFWKDSLSEVAILVEAPVHPFKDSLALYQGIPRNTYKLSDGSNFGILGFTVVFLIILSFIKLRGKNILGSIVGYSFSRKISETSLPEKMKQSHMYVVLTYLLSFSIMSIFTCLIINGKIVFYPCLFYFLLIVGYHIFLTIMIYIFGWTFNSREVSSDMVLNIWNSDVSIGLILSPIILSLFYIYSNSLVILLKILLFVAIALFILRLVRLLKILFENKFSIFYMFLYLCGLELLPILVIYKTLG